MGDGYLNKCKACTKKDTKQRTNTLMVNPDFVESERKRGREKYYRLYGYIKKDPEVKKRDMMKYHQKYPEKRIAHLSAQHVKVLNGHGHHWSYNEQHYKDVIDISEKDHHKAHRFIVYDQEQMMYRRNDTMELLDTKERHLEWINYCIQNKED